MAKAYTSPEEVAAMRDKTGWGNALGVSAIVFTIFSFICFAQGVGYGAYGDVVDARTNLSFGIIQVILFIGFFFGAAIAIKRGMQLPGQTFMTFAIAFGGVGGASNIMAYLASDYAGNMITYDPVPFGIVNMVIGILLIIEIPAYFHGTLVDWATSLLPALGLIIYGITGIGLCPVEMISPLIVAAGILFGFTGIGGMFVIAANFLEGVCEVPMGPVLFKPKDQ